VPSALNASLNSSEYFVWQHEYKKKKPGVGGHVVLHEQRADLKTT
jgi:hypothetical protein